MIDSPARSGISRYAAGEGSVEVVGDVLGYQERPVRFDDDLDIGLGQAELLRESRQGGQDQPRVPTRTARRSRLRMDRIGLPD